MEVIGSNLRTADRDFLDNQARMKALVGDLKERLGQSARQRAESGPWSCTGAEASCWPEKELRGWSTPIPPFLS